MSLNPIVKGLLDQMAADPQPKLNQQPLDEARASYVAMSAMLDAADVPIGGVEDTVAPGLGGDIPVRLYTPVAAGGGPLPVLIYFHGGGWVIGNIESHDPICRQLADASGCKVASVDYRLAPEHKFPAAADDAFSVLQWVEKNASTLGIDPNRVAVGGDSAGGNLAAVVSQMANEAGGPHIGYQLLVYPVTNIYAKTASRQKFAEGYFLELETMTWFEDQYMNTKSDAADPKASPLNGKLEGLPPARIVTAGFDPLCDEGKQYADALKASGVEVEYICHEDLVHGFFQMSGVLDVAREAVTDAGAAVKKTLG